MIIIGLVLIYGAKHGVLNLMGNGAKLSLYVHISNVFLTFED